MVAGGFGMRLPDDLPRAWIPGPSGQGLPINPRVRRLGTYRIGGSLPDFSRVVPSLHIARGERVAPPVKAVSLSSESSPLIYERMIARYLDESIDKSAPEY